MNNDIKYNGSTHHFQHWVVMIKALGFLGFTFALMFAVLSLIASDQLPQSAVLIGLFGPAFAAIAFTLVDRNAKTADLLKQYIRVKANLSIYLLAVLAIPALLLITQTATAVTGLADYSVLFSSLSIGQLIFIPLISIGEELGWRGYLQPMLRKQYSLTFASITVGCIWALWHVPGYYFGTGIVEGISFAWFSLWVISASVIMGLLYDKTHSVFIAIVFHTSANFSFNIILLMPVTTATAIPFKVFTVSVVLLAIALTMINTRANRAASDPGATMKSQ